MAKRNNTKTKKIVINAEGKSLGRLSTEVVNLLMGKDVSDYAPNKIPLRKIKVENIDKLRVTGKKTKNKIYYRHSGYPGGIKQKNFEEIFKADPSGVLMNALWGMLPKNKLRKEMLKNIEITKGAGFEPVPSLEAQK